MINIFSVFSDWALLILRLVFAAIFLAHGWPKIKNLRGTGEWFQSIGFRPGIFWGTVVALTETFGSLLIILGLGTHFIAVPFAIDMTVAMTWKIRNGQKLVNGYELDLILLVIAIFLAANGGGWYSLDNSWHLY